MIGNLSSVVAVVLVGGLCAAAATRTRIGLLAILGTGALANWLATAVRALFSIPPLTRYGLMEGFAFVFAFACGILLLRRLLLRLRGEATGPAPPDHSRS